ncbi:MAG: glycoside hydrolase [Rhodospirillales bacterium]|nr:glycoside hydrolase [Rhodospirillales bacterium]
MENRTRLITVLAASLVAALVSLAAWFAANRPVKVEGAWSAERLSSASFAPFRRGQSPMAQKFPSAQQIEQDLALLKDKVAAVRTYSSTEGLENVPRLAGKYDIKVTHAAWLSFDRARNEIEVQGLIDQANKYPDTINRVIVGNEVLLRGELPAEEIAAKLRQVRAAIKQPVSYADVWEYWLRHPQLAQEVDYITVHFLPYWEDDPVDVDGSMAHILAVYRKVKQAFPDKPILIGEVGWPSAGRDREEASPGRVMQAKFLSAFTRLSKDHGLDYNIVEALDQPWKTKLEGTVGGNWGIVDAARKPKFDASGSVTEHPKWWLGWLGAAVLGAVMTLAVLQQWPGTAAAIGLAFLAQGLASLLAVGARAGVAQWYDKSILAEPLGLFLLQALLAALLFAECARRLAAPATPIVLAAPSAIICRFRDTFWRDRLLLVLLVWACVLTWLLALRPDLPSMGPFMRALPLGPRNVIYDWLNGRYRDFLIGHFLVPTLGLFLSLALLGAFGRFVRVMPSAWRKLDLVLAALLVLPAVLLQWVENFDNREALAWGAIALAFCAVPLTAVALGRDRGAKPLEPAPLGPVGTTLTEVARGPGGRVVVIDSIAKVTPMAQGCYVVCGSHGALSAARFVVDVKPALVVFNDAGVGKDEAGIAGLDLLQQCGIPAAAVAHTSARIGDGADTWTGGVVSRANPLAEALGLKEGAAVKAELQRIVAG